MWLQLQTDLKEAIGSVWTVMGYPEPCRGAGYNNEMHLFVPPETTPPLSREDDWAVDVSIAPALSVCPGPYNSCGCATCCAEGVRGSRTNAKIRTMFCWQTRQAGTSHFLPLASWFLLSHLHSIIQFQLPSSPRAILSLWFWTTAVNMCVSRAPSNRGCNHATHWEWHICIYIKAWQQELNTIFHWQVKNEPLH